jgi:hypothetical protein
MQRHRTRNAGSQKPDGLAVVWIGVGNTGGFEGVVSGYTMRTAENASSQSYDRELRGLD